MKGIVAEIKNSNMIVIAKDGEFVKCRKIPGCNIGDEVNIQKASMGSLYKKISTAAAGFIIFAMLTSGVYAYYTPYSYVSVDINPSLELYVNRFDKVIDAHAFNADAEKLLQTTKSVKYREVDSALTQILNSAAQEGYLKENGHNSVMIVISSASKGEEKDLTAKISKASTEMLSHMSSSYEVILEKTMVESYKKAKEQNVSPGKVILANKFKEVKPEIDEEEIMHMPLQQAIKQIEKAEDKSILDKPKAVTASDKPKIKPQPKGNVIDVKELIKEKNEDLGKKLDKQKDSKVKDKDNKNNKAKDDKSSLNTTPEPEQYDTGNIQADKENDEDKSKDDKKDKQEDKNKDNKN